MIRLPLPTGWGLIFDFKRREVYLAKDFTDVEAMIRWLRK